MSESETLIGAVAEKAVIGALLQYSNDPVVGQILASTEIEDFEVPACRAIRAAAVGFEDSPFDLTTIALKLEQSGELDTVVTPAFMFDVMENSPLPVTIETHIQSLRTYRASRQVRNISNQISQGIEQTHGDPAKLSALVETSASQMTDSLVGIGSNGWKKIGESVTDLINKDHSGPSEFISTGIAELDEALGGGLGFGTVTTVAARPAFGKSAFSLDVMRRAAMEGIPCALFSLEMGQEEIAARFLGGASRIAHRAIRKGTYTDSEKASLLDWAGKIESLPTFIDTRDTVGPSDIESAYARFSAEANSMHGTGIKLLVIDYLQLMGTGQKFVNREQEVAHYMRSITKLTKRENIATILISQLNRGENKREVESRPSVRDLRESGSIEQDSDVVLLLGKPDEEAVEGARGAMDIIIGKNRNGPLQDVPVTFLAHYPTFESRVPTEGDSSSEEW